MITRLTPLLLITLILSGVGCETVESRIQKQQATFDGYPEKIQDQIRKEQIDVGYTRDMVLIALGRPDKVYTRKDKDGVQQEIWTYKGSYYNRRYLPHHDFDHDRHHSYQYQYELEEYDRLRLEFVEGKVAVIEQESQQ